MGNIVDLFYVPCLERATVYRRAVGYFTSGGLALAAKGLSSFIRGSGKMFLVASPYLDEDDCKAISQGYEARHDIIARSLVRCFDASIDDIVRDRLACLAWLIANQRLEIKIAFRRALAGSSFRPGIYHEKMGIFDDTEGYKVAFSGSSNETAGGLVDNFEAIDVFWSWDDPQGRLSLKELNFQDLWNNRTSTLEVMSFPKAAYEKLLEFKTESPPLHDPETLQAVRTLSISKGFKRGFDYPENITIRDYQKLAIEAWFSNECRGIFEMATGTGKTVTALCASLELFKREKNLGIVILAPFIHLVDQWEEAIRSFGLASIKCYEAVSLWRENLMDQITDLNIGARKVLCAIATHDTASGQPFSDTIARIRRPLLLIADEVHHLGATSYSYGLTPVAKYRLGLSATPDRWFDEEGNKILTDYFSKTVFRFSLEEAISRGFLCHYEYHPHIASLDKEETGRYENISIQIARVWNQARQDERARLRLDSLLRERVDILNCALSKLALLKTLLSEPEKVTHTLFYCAPGQIDQVVNLLANTLRMRVRRFTAEESRDERQTLLSDFEEGKQQALVAMKCLDEGVDVPAIKTAYILASSSNPREFVQRRGRILRPHQGKRLAVIHDMIAVPTMDRHKDEIRESERALLRRELARFKEFSSAADNEYEATAKILDIASEYQVLDF